MMDAGDPGVNDGLVMHYRLHSSAFWVDVRLLEINGRWIASADTPDGPSLRLGRAGNGGHRKGTAAIPGIADELLASVPRGK